MKHLQKGFTLIELLISLAVVGIVASAFFMNCSGGKEHGDEMAISVTKTASSMGFNVVSASCDGRDTDGDGKVSCTVTSRDQHGNLDARRWICPSAWSRSSTCQVF